MAAKGNQMVGLIQRYFFYMNVKMYKSVCCLLVKLHLEYAVQICSSYYRKDRLELDKVQRRMTKLIPEHKHLEDEENVKDYDWQHLWERWCRVDFIETSNPLGDGKWFKMSLNKVVSTRLNTCKLKNRSHWRTALSKLF